MNITCVAVGSPMPYVKWMQGAEDLTPEDDMPVGRNVLELTDVKDSANYTCVAMSSLGVIEAVAQITVKCKQGPWGMGEAGGTSRVGGGYGWKTSELLFRIQSFLAVKRTVNKHLLVTNYSGPGPVERDPVLLCWAHGPKWEMTRSPAAMMQTESSDGDYVAPLRPAE